jgi:hypothetical protein
MLPPGWGAFQPLACGLGKLTEAESFSGLVMIIGTMLVTLPVNIATLRPLGVGQSAVQR